ncbi:MAG: CheR family methyltransferase [Archangium sp.]
MSERLRANEQEDGLRANEQQDGLEPFFSLVAARTGTRLSRQQRERLTETLTTRLKNISAPALLEHLSSLAGARELAALLSVVSVHKTDLFRDEQQLEALREHVLRPRVREGKPVTVWSAGCSTGEEVATLLILLAESGASADSTILGTDLSDDALARARTLSFAAEAVRRVPSQLTSRYFLRDGGHYRLLDALAKRARFERHNLIDRPYPFSGAGTSFDVIVCRNVLIYFTPEAARATVEAFVERLNPGGVLVLSTAEPLLDPVPGITTLRLPGAFFYQQGHLPLPAERGEGRREGPKRPPTQAPPPPPPRPTTTGEIPMVLAPEEEGRKLFELVLEWAAQGEDNPETEAGLRKALYLAPRLAGARYLLGLLLERRGANADAANEYRRAQALLDAGDAAPSGFFLNNERLAAACRVALARLRPS